MAQNHLRLPRVLVSIFACMLFIIGTLAAVDTRPVSMRASDWVRAHAGNLPDTLAELSKYPIPYRVMAFQAQSPSVRSKLAREHFRVFRESRSLSPAQGDLLNRMESIMGPEAYTESGRERAQRLMAPLCRDVKNLFAPADAAILGTLGPLVANDSLVVRMARRTKALIDPGVLFADDAKRFDDCTCAMDTECPGCILQLGICAESECGSTWPGCGCGFIWTCDGDCWIIGTQQPSPRRKK